MPSLWKESRKARAIERIRAPVHGPLRNPVLRWLALYVLPLPRGVATVPILLTTKPSVWEDDVRQLVELIERAARSPGDAAWGESPVFGNLTREQWGALSYKHVDHHLRQFGV